MTEKIEIIERESEEVVMMSATVSTFKLPTIMGKVYKELFSYLNSIDSEAKGASYTRYLDLDWHGMRTESKLSAFFKLFTRKWKMEMGIAVDSEVPEEGEIKRTTLSAGKFLKTMHIGPYHKVGETYKLLLNYADMKNLKLKNESFEFYLNDPRETPKEKLETLVLVPLD